MSPELGKIEIESKSIKAFEIVGPLTEEQRREIENIVDGYGKFLLCKDEENDSQFLIVSGTANHKNMWNSISTKNPNINLKDAGMYDIRWGEHLIRDYSTTLINTPLIDMGQINESRAFLRDTLGINVEDAHF